MNLLDHYYFERSTLFDFLENYSFQNNTPQKINLFSFSNNYYFQKSTLFKYANDYKEQESNSYFI